MRKDTEELIKLSKENDRATARNIATLVGIVMIAYILTLWYYQRIPLVRQYFELITSITTAFLGIFIALIALQLNDDLIKITERIKDINRRTKKAFTEIKEQKGVTS